MDQDKSKNLKPLPKPVYRPPVNSRAARSNDQRADRPDRPDRRDDTRGDRDARGPRYETINTRDARVQRQKYKEASRYTPEDFPAVPRKVRPTAARETYATIPPKRRTTKRRTKLLRKITHPNNKKISTKAPRRVNQNILFWGIGGVLLCFGLFLLVYGLTKKNAYEISVNDTVVGDVMMSKGVNADSVLTAVTDKLKTDNGADVRINETISAQLVHASGGGVMAFDNMVDAVIGQVTYDVMAAAIYVDGNVKGVLKDEGEANDVLDKIKAQYHQDGLNIISDGFVEDVEVQTTYVGKDQIQTEDDVFAALTANSSKQEIYTIVKGDTLNKVAMNNGMTVDEILNANPGLTIDSTLSIGQQINISTPSPVVSVVTVEEVTLTEVDPMQHQVRTNINEPITYKKIIQQGSDGQKEVTYHVTRINGYAQTPEPIKTDFTQPEVPQIEEIGGKK